VLGLATASTGDTYGVYGKSDSTDGRGVLGDATATSGTTYGVWGQSASTDGVGVHGLAYAGSGETYGVYGKSASADGYGGYFDNIAGGTALYAAGDVAQDATAAGLVKAAVYVDCKGTFPSPPHRYFNTVSGTVTSIDFDYLTTGACILDFDFDLSNRFWVAMVYNDTNATMVSCTLSPVDNDRLICKRWDKDGNRKNGDIMVLVY